MEAINNNVQKRSDYFYFIEVWDKKKLRSKKLSKVLGSSEKPRPKYLTGGFKKPVLKSKIYYALFWKRLSSAQLRIGSMKGSGQFKECYFVIRTYTREQFFKVIPEKIDINNQFDRSYFDKNRMMKNSEKVYLKRYEKAKKQADLEFHRNLKS